MSIISKETLKSMFLKKKGKRLHLLYKYYQESYFDDCPLPAEIIAEQISKDLGIEINVHQIYYINKYYQKGNSSLTKKVEKSNTSQQEPKEEKEKKEWKWAEPEPPGSEMRKAFGDRLKSYKKDDK